MAKKQLSEVEKAKTWLSEDLAAKPQTLKSIEAVIKTVMLKHKMDRRMAVCALRDYFQVEVVKCAVDAAADAQKRLEKIIAEVQVSVKTSKR